MSVSFIGHQLLFVSESARHVGERLVPDVLVLQLTELSEHLGRKLALAHEVKVF